MQETAVTMDPPRTFRRVPLLPHQMTSKLTAQRDLFVLAHVGIPRVDASANAGRKPAGRDGSFGRQRLGAWPPTWRGRNQVAHDYGTMPRRTNSLGAITPAARRTERGIERCR